jgi:hypothetical protein
MCKNKYIKSMMLTKVSKLDKVYLRSSQELKIEQENQVL